MLLSPCSPQSRVRKCIPWIQLFMVKVCNRQGQEAGMSHVISPLQPHSLPVGQGKRTRNHTEPKNSSFLCYQGMWSRFLPHTMLLQTLNRLCSILFEQEDLKSSVSYSDLLFSQSCGCTDRVFLEIESPTFSLHDLEAARRNSSGFCCRTRLYLSVDPWRHCSFLGASHHFQVSSSLWGHTPRQEPAALPTSVVSSELCYTGMAHPIPPHCTSEHGLKCFIQFRLKMSVHMDFGTFYTQFLALIETEWLNYMKWWPLASSRHSWAYEHQISASLRCIIVGGLVFEIGAVSFCLEFYSEVFKLIYELGHISTISKMALNVLLLSCTKYLYKVTFSALMIIK